MSLHHLAERMAAVPGVVGVVLGGSRARGTHTPESDTDLGLYYRKPLDVDVLGHLAREVAEPADMAGLAEKGRLTEVAEGARPEVAEPVETGGSGAAVTVPGGWGPWVDGGGWLRIDGQAVDWIYRDLDRVLAVSTEAQQGRYAFHQQAGHPLGLPDFAYVGELALGRILADPSGELAEIQREIRIYPRKLTEALVAGLWEADFLVGVARKAVARGDSAYVAGCLFRAIGVCAHALHGAARQWLINEKGAVASAAALSGAPERFRERVDEVFGRVGPPHLAAAIDAAADLVLDTTDACAIMIR